MTKATAKHYEAQSSHQKEHCITLVFLHHAVPMVQWRWDNPSRQCPYFRPNLSEVFGGCSDWDKQMFSGPHLIRENARRIT